MPGGRSPAVADAASIAQAGRPRSSSPRHGRNSAAHRPARGSPVRSPGRSTKTENRRPSYRRPNAAGGRHGDLPLPRDGKFADSPLEEAVTSEPVSEFPQRFFVSFYPP